MIHSIPRRHDIAVDCWCRPVFVHGDGGSADDVWVHWNSKYQSEDVDDFKDDNVCSVCHRVIATEARGGPHPSPGDHDPAYHVAKAYGTVVDDGSTIAAGQQED